MEMKNPAEEGYELGTETKKRLEAYSKGSDVLGREDLARSRNDGMSLQEQQRQYDEFKAEGGTTGAGAQARMNDFTSVDRLSDFNPDEISVRNQGKEGGNDIRGGEMIALLGTGDKGIKGHNNGKGFSATEVNDYIKTKGYSLSSGAQKHLNNALAALGSETPTNITDPGDGTPVIDTAPPMQVEPELEKLPVKDVAEMITQPGSPFAPGGSASVDSSIKDNNLNTDIGDGNNFYGNFNSGIIDQGIVFNSNSSGGSSRVGGDANSSGVVSQDGAMGMGGGGMDNFGSSAATMGLLENMYNRQTTNFNPFSTASQAINRSEDQTGANQRIANLDYKTGLYPLYNQAKADQIEGRYLGDMDSQPAPSWVATADPEKYDTDLEKIANKYKV